MSAICDGCGTDKNVRREFVTIWNGNIIDLCRECSLPLAELLDSTGKYVDPPRMSDKK